MNTEITDTKVGKEPRRGPVPRRGWVLYDGACHICTGIVRRWGPALERRGFACVPLQAPWVRERLNLSEDELMLEMRVLEPSGKVIGGAAALLLLARSFGWALPLVWPAKLPGVFRLLDAAYRWGAARRYCANGQCAAPKGGQAVRARTNHQRSSTLILVLPFGALFLMGKVPPWVFMWVMAGGLWLALKLFTFRDVPSRPWPGSIIYFAWPGMDAPEFFRSAAPIKPAVRDWSLALLNIAVGVALICAGAPLAYASSALLAGWLGMVGIVLVLHFGTFQSLALLWRALGIPATPIMDAPLRSRSLSEFWGRRWNTGFSIPARRYLMEPIARRFGATAGLLTVFLISGLVHELVISLPARAGCGLPTLYFLIQAAGLVIERKTRAHRALTLLWVAAPAFILFHPPFVHRVILPFLKAMGAL